MNAKDETVQSAYLIATSEGHLDLLRLTLRNGAKIDDKDSWNGTGLIRAAERGHYGVVGQLLQAGIVRDHVNRIGYQAIHEAVWLGEDTDGYATTLRVLAAGSVQLDQPSRDEQLTPLQMAQRPWPRRTGESADADDDRARHRTMPTPRCCGPPHGATPTRSPSRCGRAQTSRPATAAVARRCCSRRPTTTSTWRRCWSRWAPTRTRSTTGTTPPG